MMDKFSFVTSIVQTRIVTDKIIEEPPFDSNSNGLFFIL